MGVLLFVTRVAVRQVNYAIYFLTDKYSNMLVWGVLLDNAQELLKQPELTESDLMRRFKVTVRDAHKHGLTSIHDAGLDPASLAFFNRYVSLLLLVSRLDHFPSLKTGWNRHFTSQSLTYLPFYLLCSHLKRSGFTAWLISMKINHTREIPQDQS